MFLAPALTATKSIGLYFAGVHELQPMTRPRIRCMATRLLVTVFVQG